MSLVPGTQLPKSWHLLSDECLLYANEITVESGLLDRFRMGAGHQKEQGMNRGLRLLALPPDFQEGEREWGLS